MADAINNAISQAVLDETIENNEDAQVSVAKEEDGTSRLVMRAESSGYTFRLFRMLKSYRRESQNK